MGESGSSLVGHHVNKLKRLDKMSFTSKSVTTPKQLNFDLEIVVEAEGDLSYFFLP